MSDAPALDVQGLGKTYVVPVREAGVRAAVASLFRRETKSVVAVGAIDFRVAPGEVVGFLGPNGAGSASSPGRASASSCAASRW